MVYVERRPDRVHPLSAYLTRRSNKHASRTTPDRPQQHTTIVLNMRIAEHISTDIRLWFSTTGSQHTHTHSIMITLHRQWTSKATATHTDFYLADLSLSLSYTECSSSQCVAMLRNVVLGASCFTLATCNHIKAMSIKQSHCYLRSTSNKDRASHFTGARSILRL